MTDTSGRLALAQKWLADVYPERDFTLRLLAGDASFRCYYRADDGNQRFVLMDAPPEQEDTGPFCHIAKTWYGAGLRVPHIEAENSELGFLLLEDFGDQTLFNALNENTAESLYPACLAALHQIQALAHDPQLPLYDEALLRREMQLFPDWLIKQYLSLDWPEAVEREFQRLSDKLVESALAQPQVCVHRDYHSRNLMICPDNPMPGIIDFQDAVTGPLTYDLVSLLKDCYVKLPHAQVDAWVSQFYETLPTELIPSGSLDDFRAGFRRMGLQRHLKAAGIFARLFLRDRKAGYLNDIPQTVQYLVEALAEEEGCSAFKHYVETDVLDALKTKSRGEVAAS